MSFVPQASLPWRIWRRLVRTRTAFFSVPQSVPPVDVLRLYDLPSPLPGVHNEHVPTIIIDLTQTEEELWNAVVPKTRKVIRQAMREGVTVERISELTEEVWNGFLSAYWKLWQRKPKAGALGVGQIGELIAAGHFALTRSRDADGHILSWHVYVLDRRCARLHTTVSDIDPAKGTAWNNLVGRAHRRHHWQDLLRFKAEGISTYDFGGVYRGSDDPAQMNIARFKQSFGGQFADSYDTVLPLTWKGRLALMLAARISDDLRTGAAPAGA